LKRLLAGLFALSVIWLAGVFVWVWIGPHETADKRADYAIVLGAAVDGDRPSPVFKARIDHAIDLWRVGTVSHIIFTGGKGQGDNISEAEAARRYAQDEYGVPTSAILVEDQSRTTMQNLVFAQPFNLGAEKGSALMVSDPLHLRRAMLMATDLGYEAYPSATPLTRYQSLSTKLPFAAREVYFLHHYWLLGE